MDAITERREQTQPIREKTGGSTFKNPEGHSSWKLIDEAGWRGKLFGGAKFSDLHPCGIVRNHGSLRRARARGQHHSQVRGDRVTRAHDVVHLARRGGHASKLPVVRQEDHSFVAEGEEPA